MLEALEKGQSVDLGSLPPPPGQGEDEKTDLTNIKVKKQNYTVIYIQSEIIFLWV